MKDFIVSLKLRIFTEGISNLKKITQDLTSNLNLVKQSVKATDKEIQNAFRKLELPDFNKVKQELNEVRQAYDTLKKSGRLSSKELYKAKLQLIRKTEELKKKLNDYPSILEKIKSHWLELAGVIYTAAKAFSSFVEFSQRMAEVNTLINVSREEFDRLSKSVVEISTRVPQTASELAAGLYDLISAGASVKESSKALELAAKAAVAGVTDTKTAIQAGMSVINAYGLSLEQLSEIYDILFATVKTGVTTFPELAHHIGNVLPTARAAGVGFREVAAAIATMTKAGIRTPQAVTALTGAIRALAMPTEETKKRLAELGIEWRGLMGTLKQIKDLGLSAYELRKIIPDEEAIKAVLSLTQNFEVLQNILGELKDSAGATKEAYDKMKDTPVNQIKMLANQFQALVITMGGFFAPMLRAVITPLKVLFQILYSLPAPIKFLGAMLMVGYGALIMWQNALRPLIIYLQGLSIAAAEASFAVRALNWALKTSVIIFIIATAIEGLIWLYKKLKGETDDFTKKQKEELKALKEKNRAIALSISLSMEQSQLEVEIERLKIERAEIIRNAIKKEIEEQRRLISVLEERKRKTKHLLNESIRKEKEYSDIIRRERQALINVELETEDIIRRIKRRTMSEEEIEEDKRLEFREKLKKATEAFYNREYELAERLAKEAQRVAEGFKNQKEAIDGVREAGDLLKGIHEEIKVKAEENLEKQKEKTKELKKEIESLDKQLAKYKERLDELNKKLEELSQKKTVTEIDADIKSAEEKLKKIQKLLKALKDKKITVEVGIKKYEEVTGKKWENPFEGFASGGFIPGYGGGDRVKALLEPGEFVVRKEAVRKYGLGFLQALNNLRLKLPAPQISLPQIAVQNEQPVVHRFEIKIEGATLTGWAEKDVLEAFARQMRRRKLCGGEAW